MIKHFNIEFRKLSQINFTTNKIVNTINPHSFCVAKDDILFKKALEECDILLPDGIGIVWAEKFLNGNKIRKIAGYDLFHFLMGQMNSFGGKVFFLGSSQTTLDKIQLRAKSDFPNVKIDSFSPPFKSDFSDDENNIMIEKINKFQPNVVFVGMTAPKQEKWVYRNCDRIEADNICAIGAVFDFYAGNVKRAPEFIIKLSLEWLHRSLKSKRLFKRNFISNPKFILHILKLKIFNK